MLNRKNENTETKQKQLQDMLMKKFKKEKVMQKNLEANHEIKIWKD